MPFILGALTGLVLSIFLTSKLYTSPSGRTCGAIIGIIGFCYERNRGTIIEAMNNYPLGEGPFLLTYIEVILEVFLFVFGLCAIILGIIQIVYIFSNRKTNTVKVMSNKAKWVWTIVLLIVALLCISTIILSPIAYGCKEMIKTIWREPPAEY